MRVVFHVDGRALELGVLPDPLVVQVVDLALGSDVPHLQACRVVDVVQAVVTQGAVHAGSRHARDLRVRDVTVFGGDGLDGVKGIQVRLRFFLGAAVDKGPKDDAFGLADAGNHGVAAHIEGHFFEVMAGVVAVVVESVGCFEYGFQFVLGPDISLVVPGVDATRVDLHLQAGDDAKVVAGAFHGPKEIRVLGLGDGDGGAIGENDVELEEAVTDDAVVAFETAAASTQSWTEEANAGRAAGC